MANKKNEEVTEETKQEQPKTEAKKTTKKDTKKTTKKNTTKETKKTGDVSEILNDMVGSGDTAKKPTTNKATSGSPKSISVKEDPRIPKEDEKFTKDFTVHYAGMVDKLPKSADKEGLTVEEIREFLQSMYPEMSKERTRFEVDRDEKRLIPIIGGGKNG